MNKFWRENERDLVKFLVCVFGLVLGFASVAVYVFRYKKPLVIAAQRNHPVAGIVVDGFERKKRVLGGNQPAVIQVGRDGISLPAATGECQYAMIIDIRYKVRGDQETLRTLLYVSGVKRVTWGLDRIIVEKTCVSSGDPNELLTWDDVWDEIEPVLNSFFNSKESIIPPQP